MNLYPTHRKGYFVYKRADRYEKWFAQRRWDTGERKSATFYSLEDAIEWINSLPESPKN
jgi:hypothetical protein